MKTCRPRHVRGIGTSPGTCSTGPAAAREWPCGASWRRLGRDQDPDARQVVQGGPQGEQPPDSAHASMARLPEQGDRLEPAEHFFDELALLLTDGIAGMTRRPRIDGTLAVRAILRDVRREPETPERGHEAPRVVALVPADGGAATQVGGH